MTNISFNSENLKVDYLSLNLQFNNLSKIEEIDNYLADSFGCRSSINRLRIQIYYLKPIEIITQLNL
jgi:hypothetical protein